VTATLQTCREQEMLLLPVRANGAYPPDSLQMAAREENFPRNLVAKNRGGQTAASWLYPHGQTQIRRTDTRSC
jgi:hypothetical protein